MSKQQSWCPVGNVIFINDPSKVDWNELCDLCKKDSEPSCWYCKIILNKWTLEQWDNYIEDTFMSKVTFEIRRDVPLMDDNSRYLFMNGVNFKIVEGYD